MVGGYGGTMPDALDALLADLKTAEALLPPVDLDLALAELGPVDLDALLASVALPPFARPPGGAP